VWLCDAMKKGMFPGGWARERLLKQAPDLGRERPGVAKNNSKKRKNNKSFKQK
jgi:hypothetical protein